MFSFKNISLKHVEGEISLEKNDKLMEVMQPKQLKPVTELAGYI